MARGAGARGSAGGTGRVAGVGKPARALRAAPARGARTAVATRGTPRLAPEARRQQIVAAATDFFADRGFEASTTALAQRLGITQPLLYRYFPTKAELISAVYEHAFPSAQYYPRWVAALARHEVPIRERLIEFYCEYTEALLNYRFLRLAIWARLSGLQFEGESFNERYNAALTGRIFPLVIAALRERAGLPPRSVPSAAEIELLQTLHGSIYYVGIRRLNDRLPPDVQALVISKIDVFLDGIGPALSRADAVAP